MSTDRIAREDQSYYPSPRKLIGPALTIAFLVFCTTLATGRTLPPQTETSTQTMKVLKGGERDYQVLATEGSSWRENRISAREERRVSGVGSHPPSCKSKCGSCVPCEAVLVPIHPGRNRPEAEYYPEAWKCKCGNQIYSP